MLIVPIVSASLTRTNPIARKKRHTRQKFVMNDEVLISKRLALYLVRARDAKTTVLACFAHLHVRHESSSERFFACL